MAVNITMVVVTHLCTSVEKVNLVQSLNQVDRLVEGQMSDIPEMSSLFRYLVFHTDSVVAQQSWNYRDRNLISGSGIATVSRGFRTKPHSPLTI